MTPLPVLTLVTAVTTRSDLVSSPAVVPSVAVLQSDRTDIWGIISALGPLAILAAAALAAIIGLITLKQRSKSDGLSLRQKRHSDDRSEWWTRAQWALDRALDDDPDIKALGMATLEVLAHSKLAHEEELELFDITWEAVSAIANVAAPGITGNGAPFEFRFSGPVTAGTFSAESVSSEPVSTEPEGLAVSAPLRYTGAVFTGALRPRSSFRHWVSRRPVGLVDSGATVRDNEGTSEAKEA